MAFTLGLVAVVYLKHQNIFNKMSVVEAVFGKAMALYQQVHWNGIHMDRNYRGLLNICDGVFYGNS